MIRVSVMYPNNGEAFDMDYYLNRHMPLCHKLLDPFGLVRTEVDKAAAPDAPYAVVAHLVFNSLADMQKGLQAHDPDLAADTPNYTSIRPQFQVSEMVK